MPGRKETVCEYSKVHEKLLAPSSNMMLEYAHISMSGTVLRILYLELIIY